MRGTNILLPLLLVAICGNARIAEAQSSRSFRPVQRLDRWLGVGNGPGYNWQNPGPDSSYYNPWSAHNSSLVSRSGATATGAYRFDDPSTNQFIPNDSQFQAPTPNEFRFAPSNAPGTPTDAGEKDAGPKNEADQTYRSPGPMRSQQPLLSLPAKSNQPTPAVRPSQPPLLSGGG